MDNFPRCFAFTLGAEGGYSNNAADPGNWTGSAIGSGELRGTKYGISAAAR
jgi:lysozyme family protein